MLKAWQANKLGRALSSAGLDTRAIRRALAGSEDALTSSVLGRVSYLPAALQWGLLSECAQPISDAPWPGQPEGAPAWEFWPSYPPAPGDPGKRVEPDVVIAWGGLTVIIEVKHHGRQHSGQWRRQLRAILSHNGLRPERVLFIALGGSRPADVPQQRATIDADPMLAGVRLYRMGWRCLNDALQQQRTQAVGGQAALLSDAIGALSGTGYHATVGIWTLPDVVEPGRGSGVPLIDGWSL